MYYIEHVTKEMGFCSSFQLILCVLFFPSPSCCTADYHPRTLQWDTDPSVLQLQSDSELGYMSALFVIISLPELCLKCFLVELVVCDFSFAFMTQKDHSLSFPFFSFINKMLQQSHLCGKKPQLFKPAYDKINCYFCCLKHNTNNYFISDEMLLLWQIHACIVTMILFVPVDSDCSP